VYFYFDLEVQTKEPEEKVSLFETDFDGSKDMVVKRNLNSKKIQNYD
jgi:hypothetical protein